MDICVSEHFFHEEDSVQQKKNYNNFTLSLSQLEEFLRERWGGVGGIGDAGAPLPPAPAAPPPPTEFRDEDRFIRIEECGLAPREKDMLAYSRTPMSRCPASMATERAVRPSLSVAARLMSGWCMSSLTISTWPCSAAHISAVLPSSSRMLTSAPASSSSWTMSSRP